MDASENNLPEVYLQPGEVCLAKNPSILKTLLGSCVGVTFWSPHLRVGALCHGILPRCPRGMESTEGHRYVDFAICDLTRQMEKLGALRSDLQVKVFGGADVLPVGHMTVKKETVGYQNWHTALQVLQDEGLVVKASDLGGLVGRTIHFNTGTGEVFLRRLIAMEVGT
jgi:chemotaxis protein CheD